MPGPQVGALRGGSLRDMGPFWLVLALIYPFTVAAYSPVQGDVWWNLSSGRWVVENHALPATYPFSFALQAGPFYDTQWLAHVVYYAIYQVLGLAGLVTANVAIITATFALILGVVWARCQNRFVAASCTLAAAVLATSNLQPRAQTFGFLLFAATYWLLTRAPRSLRTMAGLAVVQIVWSNMHGSFFLGPVLTGLVLAGEAAEAARSRRLPDERICRQIGWLGLALVVQAVATLVTPYGISGFAYAYGAMTDPTARRYGEEWLAPTLSTFTGAAFFVSVAVVLAVAAVARRIRGSDAFVMLLFAWFGLQAVRNVIWWGMAIAPVLAAQLMSTPLGARAATLEASARAQPKGRQLMDAVVAAVLLCMMAGALPWIKDSNPLVPAADRRIVSAEEPERAASFAETHDLPSRVFAPQVWGAYLGWRLWPRFTVMVGPIVEIHPSSVWADYLTIAAGKDGWDALLDRYGVDLLLLDTREQSRLIGLARSSGRWADVYSDGQATILRRGFR